MNNPLCADEETDRITFGAAVATVVALGSESPGGPRIDGTKPAPLLVLLLPVIPGILTPPPLPPVVFDVVDDEDAAPGAELEDSTAPAGVGGPTRYGVALVLADPKKLNGGSRSGSLWYTRTRAATFDPLCVPEVLPRRRLLPSLPTF